MIVSFSREALRVFLPKLGKPFSFSQRFAVIMCSFQRLPPPSTIVCTFRADIAEGDENAVIPPCSCGHLLIERIFDRVQYFALYPIVALSDRPCGRGL